MHKLFLVTAALTLGFLFPQPGAASEDEDIASIRSVWETYEETRISGDIDAWLDLWDRDALRVPIDRPPRTKEELEEITRRLFDVVEVVDLDIHSEEIVIMGDWAFSRGRYDASLKVTDRNVDREGNFLAVFRRQTDGSWRIHREMVIPLDEALP